MTERSKQKAFWELRQIPGVGVKTAQDLWNLGIKSVRDLQGRDPEELYLELGALAGGPVDRCMLYVFRCAVYYASKSEHDPELLKWWNWKDAKRDTGAELFMTNIAASLKGRDLLTLHDFTPQEIAYMLNLAAELKQNQKHGQSHQLLKGKTLAMLFQKSSTRTRVSFEVGMFQLGGHALFLNTGDLQLGRGETIADTGRVLGRYVDGIMIRTFAQSDVKELAEHSPVPVINGLTDLLHPCQVLADLQTVREHKGKLARLKLAYVGDGNNVCHSLLYGCAKTGMYISVASPEGYLPKQEIVAAARQDAAETGATVTVTTDPAEAVAGVDVVVTDVWASMGQESEQQARMKIFAPYQVNAKLVAGAAPDYIFMHCLPAHRGEEVEAEIIDGPRSVVFDEAENRLHAQKAILALLMA